MMAEWSFHDWVGESTAREKARYERALLPGLHSPRDEEGEADS